MAHTVPELVGKRIRLERLCEDHISGMHAYAVIPEFYRHMESLEHQTMEQTREYFNRLMKFVEQGAMYWAIIRLSDQKLIGTIGIRNIDVKDKCGDLGLGLSPMYWNTGLAADAIILALDYYFNQAGYHSLVSLTSVFNDNAIRIMEFFDYRDWEILKGHYKRWDGTVYDAKRAVLKKEIYNSNIKRVRYAERWVYAG
jgi:RimJ/RimL family protein N-acetyltransferase